MITPVFKTERTIINGQVIEYESTGTTLRGEPIKEADARELLHKVKECFDEAGIQFALVCGTLLGAVRDKSIINGDGDMDICVWDEEKLRANLYSMQQKGLKVCGIYRLGWYCFTIDFSCTVDVYILRELKGILDLPWYFSCVSLFGWVVPRKFFVEWEEIEFLGEKVLCPANPERILEFWYGSDWRIPQNKRGIYSVKSAIIFRKIVFGIPHYFMDKLKKVLDFTFDPNYRQYILDRKKETGSYFHN